MDRNRRFEAIAVCDEATLKQLAERVLGAASAVNVLREPAPGMVMMQARESAQGAAFNLGEVTVAEAEVEIDGQRGYAMCMGRNAARALAGAIVDAGAEALPGLRAAIEAHLTEALAADDARRRARWQRVAGTRVEFDEIP